MNTITIPKKLQTKRASFYSAPKLYHLVPRNIKKQDKYITIISMLELYTTLISHDFNFIQLNHILVPY